MHMVLCRTVCASRPGIRTPILFHGRPPSLIHKQESTYTWQILSRRSSALVPTRRLKTATARSRARSRPPSAPQGSIQVARQGCRQGRSAQEPSSKPQVGYGQAGCSSLKLSDRHYADHTKAPTVRGEGLLLLMSNSGSQQQLLARSLVLADAASGNHRNHAFQSKDRVAP